MPISHHEYAVMLQRTQKNCEHRLKERNHEAVQSFNSTSRETALHRVIMDWCDHQWPRWKYIHSRTDTRSTVAVGVADLIIFGPHPLCILAECKTASGKLSEAQQIWATEMRCLGWTVHLVRDEAQFHAAVEKERKRPI